MLLHAGREQADLAHCACHFLASCGSLWCLRHRGGLAVSPACPSLPSPSTRAEQERAGHRLSHRLPFASHTSRAWSCHQLHASHASPEQ